MPDVVVVGGGISGLATVYFLKKFGVDDVTLVEKETRCGGKIETVLDDGFVVEKGPNGFLDNRPHTLSLCVELGLKKSLIPSSDVARRRFIYTSGKLMKIPETPVEFIKSPILSWRGKLSLLKEPFVSPARYEESVFEFAERRLGREFAEKFIDPMVAGVFAGDARKISLKAAFPVMWQLEKEHGSLIKAFVKLKFSRKASKGPSGFGRLYSLRGGLKVLIDALSSFLSGNIKTGCSVKGFAKRDRNYLLFLSDGSTLETKAVVFSTPSYITAGFFEDVDKDISSLLRSIPYVPVAVVALGFKSKEEVEGKGFGFLVPSMEKRKILGCLWDSFIFPDRAREDFMLFRVMMGGARAPELVELDENILVDIALSELREIMEVKLEPVKSWVFKHEMGIPQYIKGHTEVVDNISNRLLMLFPGIFLNNNAYRGVGMNDCVANSEKTALKIKEYLEGL